MNHFKIGPIRGDQPGADGACGECNQRIKMQIAEFVRGKPACRTNLSQDLPRLDPVVLCGSQNGMISRQGTKKLSFPSDRCSTPQLGQNDGRGPNQAGQGSNSLLMTSGSQIIDKN